MEDADVSRTRKGSKGVGHEVDRKREGKRGYRSAGAVAKRIGRRAQRRQGAEAALGLADGDCDCPLALTGMRHLDGCPRR